MQAGKIVMALLTFENKKIHMIGIKGTGMTALAELLCSYHATVQGSDTAEIFYTDVLLAQMGIRPFVGFDAHNIDASVDMVIYSAAYGDDNAELKEARRLQLPCYSYHNILGSISQLSFAVGVTGTHGKTSTTALLAILLKSSALPASLLVGSALPQLDNKATLTQGQDIFVAETCEYKRHFLSFHPNIIVITSLDADHLDYFKDLDDVKQAFHQYIERLTEVPTQKGIKNCVVYCADEANVVSLIAQAQHQWPQLEYIPYGFSASGDFAITQSTSLKGKQRFQLAGSSQNYELSIPGKHNISNATAALAVLQRLFLFEERTLSAKEWEQIIADLAQFHGATRRSQKIGEAHGITIVDDYGHHPDEIRQTIIGLREFYQPKRIILDFMSHTYTRTEALFDGFCDALCACDILLLHPVYGSARETIKQSDVGERMLNKLTQTQGLELYAVDDFDEASHCAYNLLESGDLFVTMGAGDNWQVGERLLKILQSKGANIR